MGKPTGFLEYERETGLACSPKERIRHFNEFHEPLSLARQQRQGARCMDCGVPFCQAGMMLGGMATGCPLHNLIPEWNDLIFAGSWEEAYKRLQKTNSFPEFTGRVCPALCEVACTSNLNGEPTSIRENERAIIEQAFHKGYIKPTPPQVRTGKKIAVIGSGPAGLAAADRLNKRGHSVTVYERFDRIGGLLMYGIPNMKLDKSVVERRVEMMKAEGVEFVTGVDVGAVEAAGDREKAGANAGKGGDVGKNDVEEKDAEKNGIRSAGGGEPLGVQELLKQYDGIVLACGASNPRDIKAPGREASGIYFAVDFLRANTKSLLDSGLTDGKNISAKGKNVMVIGGGDTGNDCVGTAIRHGCKSIIQLEMMPKPPTERQPGNPWPQWPRILKTDYGQEEAIAVFGRDPRVYQTTVKEFIADAKGKLKKVVTICLESKRDEKTGRMVMEPVKGSEQTLDIDLVLIAAGFLGSQEYVSKAFGVELDARGNVKTQAGRYATNVKKVFTAGDMHRGQSLVVWGIYEGREAAREIDEFLMGYTNL